MSRRALIFDTLVLAVWIIVLLFELIFIQDIIVTTVALFCTFLFAALLGRDVRRARQATTR